jgi:hypothetical protein
LVSNEKSNLKTFKTLSKSIKTKIETKLVQLREEKNLMSRFLITARKRPELELEHCIGNYGFSLVPKSLFSVDGLPLPCTDKANLVHHLEEMASAADRSINVMQQNSAIIIDGMAVVNEITKDVSMKTCRVRFIFKYSRWYI